MGVVNLPSIPASVQKPLMIGAAVGIGLFAIYAFNRGVKGVTSDIAGGIVGGAFDATAGLLQGSYNAIPEAVKPSSHENVVSKTFNAQWKFWTGDNFGGWLYDITH